MAEREVQTRDIGLREAAAAALDVIRSMVGKEPVGVTSLEPTDDGWLVAVEVLEQERVPRTSDILALYEVEIDLDGEIISYRRTRRYLRADTGESQWEATP
ncbi:gas vesicle protein [Actinocrinis puniceicyclus]|uniref:Gas vesicle protein n=1 Tax=Actinocrinis puniceicyclus TaxID=977794 RepID=A0A8J7WM76_9ACTN|nr:gas vesicle protein [Actinocrinis puniceicyclus]MBS2964936.1 gas vesicle protein [Actinocrinis puniceicyclus]